MVNPIDLNSIDSVDNISQTLIPENYVDFEELTENENIIKQQYLDFENLGINLMITIDKKFKQDIFANMLNYINDNYLCIADYDAATILPQKLLEIGDLVYNFICVDFYNTILPNFLILIKCSSLEEFDLLIKNKYKNNFGVLKTNLVKTTKNIVEELLKLQRIDATIQVDKSYQKLMRKYTYYLDLLDFGDTERLLNNYIKPLLVKNFNSILWRIN
jgi:hypothetical protein